jgi:signal transduction histidine kinase
MGEGAAFATLRLVWRILRERLEEPSPPRPTRPSRTDLLLAGAAALIAVVEGALRSDLPLPLLQIAAAVVIAGALALRRARPLVALGLAFGVANTLTCLGLVLSLPDLGLVASLFVLLLPYSLLRLGSGREIAAGLVVVLATYGFSAFAGDLRDPEDAIGALVVLLFPAALGAVSRAGDHSHRRELEHAQLRERQMLARELHDTVAHRVAAIAIQSQAARAVLAKRPDAAAAALSAIEGEASRARSELRGLVGALRDDAPATLAPGGLAGIEELVRDAGAHAHLEREGDLGAIAPSVEHALHRIVRESLHNVARHGRGVGRIDVRLVATTDEVTLTVRDDGQSHGEPGKGYGLVGMKERAHLLGGRLEAGPSPTGGWLVESVLPRRGAEGAGA